MNISVVQGSTVFPKMIQDNCFGKVRVHSQLNKLKEKTQHEIQRYRTLYLQAASHSAHSQKNTTTKVKQVLTASVSPCGKRNLVAFRPTPSPCNVVYILQMCYAKFVFKQHNAQIIYRKAMTVFLTEGSATFLYLQKVDRVGW